MTTTFDFSRRVELRVTTTEDQNDGSSTNGLSLRDAILQANANPSKEYTIILPSGVYELSQKNVIQPPSVDDQTIDLPTLIESRRFTGDLDITGNITIIGEDPSNTIIDGSGLLGDFEDPRGRRIGDRIFEVEGGAFLDLRNVTVQNGIIRKEIIIILTEEEFIVIPGNTETVQKGGAINIQPGANVIIRDSIIANSFSDLEGGGINNDGTLTLINTIVANNQAGADQVDGTINPTLGGGGIYNTGTMLIESSSIASNMFVRTGLRSENSDFIFDEEVIEGGGAGILNETGARMTVVNTTIANNTSRDEAGGGILSRGQSTIINSTITQNIAQLAPGIWGETTNSNVLLINTIVADNFYETEVFVLDANGNQIPIFNPDNIPLFDKNRNSIFADNSEFNFYSGNVFIEVNDPFAINPRQEINQGEQINLEQVVFDSEGKVAFVFANDFDVSQNFEGLVFLDNEDENFVFAYQEETSGNLVYLDSYFDEEGNLVFIDSVNNSVEEFTNNIFLVDKNEEFTFSTFNNNIQVNNQNRNQITFVYDNNGLNQRPINPINFEQIRDFETEFINPLENSPRPDIDGFFNSSSSFNLIGITNGILDEVNNNIVGTAFNKLDPLLLPFVDENGYTIAYIPTDNSPTINAGNSDIIGLQQFFPADPVDQFGNPRINGDSVDIGSVESEFNDVQSVLTETDSLLNTSVIRFQNKDIAGTYLYVKEAEAKGIRANYPNFTEEGQAFKVANQQADGLIAINRFQNTAVPGAYLFVTEEESVSIRQNYKNLKEEGTAFYVYDANAGIGEDVYRFQSVNLPGTYLFVLEAEKNNIQANFSNQYRLEGVAFEVAI